MKNKQTEIALVLSCANIEINTNLQNEIVLLGKQVTNWNFVITFARQNNLLSFVYISLSKYCSEFVPEDILKQLKQYYINIFSRNVFLSRTLLEILELFNKNDIFAVPFKGPVLAESIYKDIALRTFCDLDILISKTDAIKTYKLLLANNYLPEKQLSDKQLSGYLETEYNFTVTRKDHKVTIDLQWQMSSKYLKDPYCIENLKPDLSKIQLLNKEIYTVGNRDLLIYLCHHGVTHCWSSLEQILCIKELLIHETNQNILKAHKIAKKKHCEREFLMGLNLCNLFFNIKLPDEIFLSIKKDEKLVSLSSDVYKRLLDDRSIVKNELINFHFSSFHFKIKDSFFDRVQYFIHLLTKPTKEDWHVFNLPGMFTFLYRILRPSRLAIEFIKLRIKI